MFSQFGISFSLLPFKCHLVATVTVLKYVHKETMKKIPGSSNISVNDLKLIRKVCTLPISSHMSALIKLKKKKIHFKVKKSYS